MRADHAGVRADVPGVQWCLPFGSRLRGGCGWVCVSRLPRFPRNHDELDGLDDILDQHDVVDEHHGLDDVLVIDDDRSADLFRPHPEPGRDRRRLWRCDLRHTVRPRREMRRQVRLRARLLVPRPRLPVSRLPASRA